MIGAGSQAASLLSILERLAHPRLLVVGDLILDRYTWGNAERVSQEAPVILLRADQREYRLGGAANVCQMVRGLEADVTCAGVVGQDEFAQELIHCLSGCGVDSSLVLTDPSRPTTLKERFIGRAQGRHPHQMLRVDTETREPLNSLLTDQLWQQLQAQLPQFQAVLISDYAKGVCTPELMQRLIVRCQALGIPVLVDPIRLQEGQRDYYQRYRGATSMTPNRLEAELATGTKIGTPQDAYKAGHKLCAALELQSAIVTLDRDGMALVAASGQGEHFPVRAREVYDITGAGDMVLAMIGVGMASGCDLADCVRLGNVAGGLEVEKVGVAVIHRHEIAAELRQQMQVAAGNTDSDAVTLAAQSALRAHERRLATPESKVVPLEVAATRVAHLKRQGQKVVFTNGCFDLLHAGHASYLYQAAQLGDALIVAVNADDSVRRLKGPTRPVIGEADRAAMLAALACVDLVIVFKEETPHRLLRALQPDVLVKGGTYTTDEVVGKEVVLAYGGEVRVTGALPGRSTTAILHSVRQPEVNHRADAA